MHSSCSHLHIDWAIQLARSTRKLRFWRSVVFVVDGKTLAYPVAGMHWLLPVDADPATYRMLSALRSSRDRLQAEGRTMSTVPMPADLTTIVVHRLVAACPPTSNGVNSGSPRSIAQ